MSAVITGQYLVVAEQQPGRYTPHLFTDRAQFQTWMQTNRPRNIRAASAARGRCLPAVDHRDDASQDDYTEHLVAQYEAREEAAWR